jgi:hypothetical protein
VGGRLGRRFAVALIVVLLVVGCSTWTTEQAQWTLIEESTGEVLHVRAEFGGSSCTRFKQWQIEETLTSVEIVAVIERSDAEDCTTDLVSEEEIIKLDAPLGDRTLTGCRLEGERDCRVVRPLGEAVPSISTLLAGKGLLPALIDVAASYFVLKNPSSP